MVGVFFGDGGPNEVFYVLTESAIAQGTDTSLQVNTIVGLGHNIDRTLLLIIGTAMLTVNPGPSGCHEHVASIFAQLHSKGVNLGHLLVIHCDLRFL
jgi:uncharacterized membrane protein